MWSPRASFIIEDEDNSFRAVYNVDENQEAAGEYGIMSIPTLLIMKNGEVLEEKTGYQPKEALVELLSKY